LTKKSEQERHVNHDYLGPEEGNPFVNASSAPTFSLNSERFPSCNLETETAFGGSIRSKLIFENIG